MTEKKTKKSVPIIIQIANAFNFCQNFYFKIMSADDRLINLVQANLLLYETESKEYRNQAKRESASVAIATEIKVKLIIGMLTI